MEKNKLEKISGALALIFFGVLFLLVNLGYLSYVGIFSLLFRYWPVFIIVAGIKIVLGGMKFGQILSFIVDILVYIAIITFAFMYKDISIFNHNTEYINELKGVEITQEKVNEMDKFETISYDFDIAASTFSIVDDGEMPVSITGEKLRSLPVFKYEVKDKVLNVDFKSNDNKQVYLFGSESQKYDVKMNNGTTPINLSLQLGAVDGDIKLNKSVLNNIKVEVGAGNVVMDLRDSKLPNSLKLDVGAGNVTIKVKKTDNISIKYGVGVGMLNINGEGIDESFGGLSANGNYSITKDPLSSYISFFDISVGAGNVDIEVE